MTMPPLVLLLFFIALLGWPILKLIATFVGRPKWRAQRALRQELLATAGLQDIQRKLVEHAYKEGKGDPIQLVLPAVAFFASIAVAIKFPHDIDELDIMKVEATNFLSDGQELSTETVNFLQDSRYRRLHNNSFELAALRYLVCSILTIISITPAAIIMSLISKFKLKKLDFASRIVIGSRNAVLAFEQSIGHPCRGL